MEELRKDVECTTQLMPTGMGATHPHQVAAAAAVAASVLASRNAAAAAVAVSKYNSALEMHRPPLNPYASAALSRSEGAESTTSMISPRSPPDSVSAPQDSRSPPIRVTDSDG